MTRLLVTGASGLLGISLAIEAFQRGYQVTGVVNQHPLQGVPFAIYTTDLARAGAIDALFESCQPEAVIHCAAVANLETAEANPALAQRLNAELPGQLASQAYHRGIRFIHISTDAIFDGVKGDYSEKDRPNPKSVYARTKLAGEQVVASACPDALIARVNFYGWSLSGRRSLAEFFFNQLNAGQRTLGFTDVIFCPLLVNDLADLLLTCLEKGLSGLYHVASREGLSKYAFGVGVARYFGLDETLIIPVSVLESNLVAQRSPNLSLKTDKLSTALNLSLPDQAAGLRRFYTLFRSGYPQTIQSFNG